MTRQSLVTASTRDHKFRVPAVKLGGAGGGGAAGVLNSVVGGVVGVATGGGSGGVGGGGGGLGVGGSGGGSGGSDGAGGMRGLAVFISDIRNCKSREAEIKRINKELANIRSKFRGDKTLDGYQKKKYVCKLLFIFLLGHDIDFGHMEAVNLLSSNKYTEKQIGYLFISVLVNPNSELMKLVIQSLKNDLASKNPVHVCLALTCIANLGSKEMAEAFGKDIPKFLTTGDSIDSVKQSASLCLLKLFRAHPDCLSPGDWASRVVHLLNDQHLGVVTAASSLIDAVVRKNPEEYKNCATLAVSRLSRLVTSSYTDLQDYTYYFVPAPWLSVKLLRLLQNWPDPNTAYDGVTRAKLVECLDTVLNKAAEPPKSKKVQHSNARNAVLFEAIDLIAHCFSSYSPNESAAENFLMARACEQLGRFLQHRETNLRYLALESMRTLVEGADPGLRAAVKRHREAVVAALRNERDASVRRRAADLLYASCDESCEDCEEICSNLMAYLTGEGCVGPADYTAREETVLKIAALAESYARDYAWYVDTILNLIRVAGDHVGEEVWYRAVQIIVNREEVQGYAAKTVFEALLQRPPLAAGASQAVAASNATHYFCHENMVKVAGYVLGEFGNLIAGDPRSAPAIQFQALHSKFALCSAPTRALLLSTYVKFINLFPEIKAEIQEVLRSDTNIRNSDPEIQQRAVEYLKLSSVVSTDVLAVVLEEMPPFPERETSLLLGKLRSAETSATAPNNGPHSQPGPALPKRPPTTPAQTSRVHQTERGGATDDLLLLSLGSPPHPTPSSATNITTNGGSLTDIHSVKHSEQGLPVGRNNTNGLSNASTRDILLEIFHDSEAGHPHDKGNLNGELHKTLGLPTRDGQGETGVVVLTSAPRPQILAPFWSKPGAVLFENAYIQVGAKLGDFVNGSGSLQIFYGNKSASSRFTSLRAHFTTGTEEPLGFDANCLSLSVQPLEVDSLEPGSQLQQRVGVECLAPPEAPFPQPQLCLEFCKSESAPGNLAVIDPFSPFTPSHDGGGGGDATQTIKLKSYLPLTLNSFLEPLGPQTPMDQAGFFQRWKSLVLPGQEYQKIFGATVLPIDPEANRTKLTNFGFAVLPAIDSNTDNAVGAGIIKTKSLQVGCLLRLEPNMKTQMYRLTLRTTKPAISLELGTLLTDMGIF